MKKILEEISSEKFLEMMKDTTLTLRKNQWPLHKEKYILKYIIIKLEITREK